MPVSPQMVQSPAITPVLRSPPAIRMNEKYPFLDSQSLHTPPVEPVVSSAVNGIPKNLEDLACRHRHSTVVDGIIRIQNHHIPVDQEVQNLHRTPTGRNVLRKLLRSSEMLTFDRIKSKFLGRSRSKSMRQIISQPSGPVYMIAGTSRALVRNSCFEQPEVGEAIGPHQVRGRNYTLFDDNTNFPAPEMALQSHPVCPRLIITTPPNPDGSTTEFEPSRPEDFEPPPLQRPRPPSPVSTIGYSTESIRSASILTVNRSWEENYVAEHRKNVRLRQRIATVEANLAQASAKSKVCDRAARALAVKLSDERRNHDAVLKTQELRFTGTVKALEAKCTNLVQEIETQRIETDYWKRLYKNRTEKFQGLQQELEKVHQLGYGSLQDVQREKLPAELSAEDFSSTEASGSSVTPREEPVCVTYIQNPLRQQLQNDLELRNDLDAVPSPAQQQLHREHALPTIHEVHELSAGVSYEVLRIPQTGQDEYHSQDRTHEPSTLESCEIPCLATEEGHSSQSRESGAEATEIPYELPELQALRSGFRSIFDSRGMQSEEQEEDALESPLVPLTIMTKKLL